MIIKQRKQWKQFNNKLKGGGDKNNIRKVKKQKAPPSAVIDEKPLLPIPAHKKVCMKTLEQIRQNVKLPDWKAELKRLKLEYIKKTAPGFYAASGSDTMKLKPWNDKTTNGLTAAIIDWITYSGHYANRINTQGQARIKKIPRHSIFSGKIEYTDKVEYTKGTTARGTPDIDSIINGLPVKIEVKAGKDKIRDEQTKQGNRIIAAGGIYFVCVNMDQFVRWYRKTFN